MAELFTNFSAPKEAPQASTDVLAYSIRAKTAAKYITSSLPVATGVIKKNVVIAFLLQIQ